PRYCPDPAVGRLASLFVHSYFYTCSFVLFLLLLRPPPGSFRFPYTTLFRSRAASGSVRCSALSADVRTEISSASHAASSDDAVRDRKSTRLNSSHVKISYAVFCLKKKT